ncbi:MAG: tRNA (guanine-N1)-methyltransferase [Candidatus Hecatellales archaeon]|nr:MAG: tRNA (guanine-N1)-methyltransferase [Candidatus Hecatellales archaeon]
MKALCLKVELKDAEKALRLLRRLGFLSGEFKPSKQKKFLLIPVQTRPPERLLEDLGLKAELVEAEVERRNKPKNLREALKGKIPGEMLEEIPRSLDIIGHVAVVELPPSLEPYGRLLGEAIMQVHRNVETVMAKAGPVSGETRVRALKLLAGKPETLTVHREHGCLFKLDVAKVYFSPRLSFEHARVAGKVQEGEKVLDMFAGVGPFSILIAKRLRRVEVYAVDVNPEAYRFLVENVRLNRVEGKVKPLLGDIKALAQSSLKGLKFNRIIMNLPGEAYKYLGEACQLSMPGTTIHYYAFAEGEEALEKAAEKLVSILGELKCSGRILEGRLVREIAPRRWQVALDFQVEKLGGNS